MKKNSFIKKILNYSNLALIISFIFILIIAKFLTPGFYSFGAVESMLSNDSPYMILAVGMLFVLITGGIDISVGSTLALSAIITTKVMLKAPFLPPIIYLIIGITVGALCGFINGFLIGKLGMVPMIVTLATMYIYRGLSYIICPQSVFPHLFTDPYKSLSKTKICGFDSVILWTLLLVIIAGFFLRYIRLGRHFYAIGSSKESAQIAGINTKSATLSAYIICGACAGFAGVLYSSSYAMAKYDIGTGYEMKAIMICILGGVSIMGGKGRIDGVVIACLFTSVLTSLLSLIPGFNIWQDAILSFIMIIVLIISVINLYMNNKRKLKEKGELI